VHDLNLTEHTLVVTVEDTSQGSESGQTEGSFVLQETAPSFATCVRDEELVGTSAAAAAHGDTMMSERVSSKGD
jgi:hypothetical protein